MTEPTHAASELVAACAAAQLFERCQLVRPPFDLGRPKHASTAAAIREAGKHGPVSEHYARKEKLFMSPASRLRAGLT
jgi:hypothetical protein